MKCPICFVEMQKRGTVHLMKGSIGTISIPAYAQVCPHCGHIELKEIQR